MEKIYTGSDKARELGFKNFREMLRGFMDNRKLPYAEKTQGEAVFARVDFGRWIADCECGGAGYVEPSDPVFYCATCGNAANGGQYRPVTFPEKRLEIEQELLERKVIVQAYRKPVDAAMTAMSAVPGLARSWRPGETVKALRVQRKLASGETEAE